MPSPAALLGLPDDYTPPTPLRAGPVTMLLSGADLRALCVGGVEVVSRIYVAVRDQDWGTVPPTLDDFTLDVQLESFRLRFIARHRWPGIGFDWQGSITGNADGSIDFSMDGVATTGFLRNRIGFCILHPASWHGQPCLVEHTDGRKVAGRFPGTISPHQPFFDLRALTQTLPGGAQVEVRMEGDTFEMEDQRNWTDASYKTYSTPLAIPYPVAVQPGDRVRQAVRIRLHGAAPRTTSTAAGPLAVRLSSTPIAQLPSLGLGSASHAVELDDEELAYLSALHLSHLRVDLDPSTPDCQARLARAVREATAIGAALEVALHLGEDRDGELTAVADMVRATKPNVTRWLVFHRHTPTTPTDLIPAARAALAPLTPDAAIGGGTNLYFTHLNRVRPPATQLDCVAYSINPQVHAFDNLSLVETLATQPMTVASAMDFCGATPIVISPITLRPRFNPDASGPPPPPDPARLPDNVDPRQPSLFAAAWTLGSLAALAPSSVAALTYYETTGLRGVMASATEPSPPELFPAGAGEVYPLYHVLADVGEFAGAAVLATSVANPRQLAVLSLRHAARRRTLIANLTPDSIDITVEGLAPAAQVRTLDQTSLDTARRSPDHYRRQRSPLVVTAGAPISLTLSPYAVLCIDDLT